MTARPGPARGRAPPPAGGAPPPGPWGRAPPPPATPACRSAAPRPRSPSSTRPARHTVPWLPFPAIVASTAPSSRGADPAGGRLPPLRLDQEPDSEPSAGVAGWLPSDYPMWLHNLARLYRATGRYADAEALFKRAIAISEKALRPDHPDLAIQLNNLAELYQDTGRHAEAEPLYARAIAIGEKTLAPDHPHLGIRLGDLALLYYYNGRYREAEPLFERAVAISEKALGP